MMIQKLFCLLMAVSLSFSLSACGSSDAITQSAEAVAPAAVEAGDSRHLRIRLQADTESTAVHFASDELGGNFPQGLSYHHVANVTIDAAGTVMPLEAALKEGSVTEEDIFYYARMDARDGLCEEVAESRLGVSGYTYHYPEYSLFLTYDVYELPDGSLYPISCCDIFLPVVNGTEYHYGPYTSFPDGDTGFYNDREDWGIGFTVSAVTPTGITVSCSQSGGQQIGTLNIYSYDLSTENAPIERLVKNDPARLYPDADIAANGKTEFSIDWAADYGTLPTGSYILTLYLQDVFTPEQVHPLMKDYHTYQEYDIPFTVK